MPIFNPFCSLCFPIYETPYEILLDGSPAVLLPLYIALLHIAHTLVFTLINSAEYNFVLLSRLLVCPAAVSRAFLDPGSVHANSA